MLHTFILAVHSCVHDIHIHTFTTWNKRAFSDFDGDFLGTREVSIRLNKYYRRITTK